MLYDYIIVGGGPAGSFISYLLSQKGARCIIMEKLGKIGEKTCGGFLPERGRALLSRHGICTEELIKRGAVKIAGSFEYREGKAKHYHYRGEEYGLGLMRNTLDTYLLECASSSGVEVMMDCAVDDYEIDDGKVRINGVIGKKAIWAVGARGLSTLAQAKDQAGFSQALKKQSFGISEIIRCRGSSVLSSDSISFWYDDDGRGYFWCIPVGRDLWNIGYWSADTDEAMLKKFIEKRAGNIPGVELEYETVFKPRGAFCGNVDLGGYVNGFCCGDVAGCNIGSTGEGLAPAFENCEIIAEKAYEL